MLTEAHRYSGISFSTLTKLIKKGVISYEADVLDGRVKLVKKVRFRKAAQAIKTIEMKIHASML